VSRASIGEDGHMKASSLLVLLPLAAACGPSKSDSIQAFIAVTSAASSAQSRAVADAQTPDIVAPAALTLSFNGPCTLGGTVGVTGDYDTAGTGESAAFDLTAAFDSCREPTGTLDGDLRWTSIAEANRFAATMEGAIDYDGTAGNFTCDFDLSISVETGGTGSRSSFSGSFCGFDVVSDFNLQTGGI
jgi:hypothetical protein